VKWFLPLAHDEEVIRVVQRLQSKRVPNFYATLQAKYCILKMQTA